MREIDELREGIAKALLDRRGFGFYIDPMEGGQDAYDITLEALDEADAVLAPISGLIASARAEDQRRIAELEALHQRILTWAEQRCPCNEDQPDPCPLCDATVVSGVCLSAERTIPAAILKDLRLALRSRSSAEKEGR